MIEYIISAGINASSPKLQLPQEFDCSKNYAIICQTDEKDYPWDYPYPKVYNVSGGTMVITDTSSTSAISISLI
jgi:hypothetical protein